MRFTLAWSLRRPVLHIVLIVLFPALAQATDAVTPQPVEQPRLEEAALPHVGPVDARGLPQVLNPGDVRRYRRIFALQDAGRWEEANELIDHLADRRLLGHVLEQRYMHPTAYRSKYNELRSWLARYADHPGAHDLYQLALSRRPDDASTPPAPDNPGSLRVDLATLYDVLEQDQEPGQALAQLASADSGSNVEEAEQPFTVGRGTAGQWKFPGDESRAAQIAERAGQLEGSKKAHNLWKSGIAAWSKGDISEAAAHFQAVVVDDDASAWTRSAAAYWAARAALRLGQPQEMSRWLRVAMEYPRSFYGMLAYQALGVAERFEFAEPSYDPETIKALFARPGISRAIALIQVGQRERAAAEMRALGGDFNHHEAEVLLHLMDQAGLPAMAFRLATRMESIVGPAGLLGTLDVGLFPLPPWEPKDGFELDRALIYALIRQESAFDPSARSQVGATGLMQIMPATASYMAGDDSLAGANSHLLLEPEYNLQLAQRYVRYLLDNDAVGGDLVRMAAAYNAGPGNLQRWLEAMKQQGIDTDDPLLVIENLPAAETRLFIRRVLTNLWAYRLRLNQEVPSLERLAAGEWPEYKALD